MRRRLSFLVLAVTSMVVLAFVIPLGLTVKDQVEARALSRGQETVQAVASGLAVAASLSPDGRIDPELATLVVAAAAAGDTTIFLPDGTLVGAPAEDDEAVAVARGGQAITVRDDGGAVILAPVSTAAGTLVVRTFVGGELLTEGVAAVWIGLGLLGAVLIAAAVLVADRLGRTLVRPVSRLAGAARTMASGDLAARVEPEGPAEIADAGAAFNHLAEQLDDLLVAERESVADLSHQLRTPLTALRLQAEMLDNPAASEAMLDDIDRLGRQVDAIITEARRPATGAGRRRSDLAAVTATRVEFWSVLAEEQDRDASAAIPAGPIYVGIPEDELADAIDTLLDNVFAHTAAGVAYSVSVTADPDGGGVLVVEDAGSGFDDHRAAERGRSGAGSTGLGLDIVRRTADRSGGGLTIGASPFGGARVVVRVGPPGG